MNRIVSMILVLSLLIPSAHALDIRTPLPIRGIAPSPEPTTVEPYTSSFFDYDAIIANPDDYKGICYWLVGTTNLVDTIELDSLDMSNPHTSLLTVDGDIARMVYIVFDNPDGEIVDGDTVWLYGECIGTTDIRTSLGIYVKMPLIIAKSVKVV